jgi:hypothetical protein
MSLMQSRFHVLVVTELCDISGAAVRYDSLLTSFFSDQPTTSAALRMDSLMTSQQNGMCERLKRMGYSEGKRIRLYGEEFDLTSDPFAIHDNLVFIDGVERRSGAARRVRIPLPVVQMIRRDTRAA